MDMIREMLPVLIPLLVAWFALTTFALVHVLRHPHYRFGNKVMWVLIVLLVSFIGPIAYLVFGRGEEQ